jgi:hypothetical protein
MIWSFYTELYIIINVTIASLLENEYRKYSVVEIVLCPCLSARCAPYSASASASGPALLYTPF